MIKRFVKENPIILFFSSFQLMHQLSIGVVIPFWSLMLLEAGWSTEQITYFFAISAFVVFLFGGVIGKLADSFGKKKVILFGLIIQASFFALYYFIIENIWLMLVFRFFEIISFLCISMVSLGALEDFVENDNRGFWTGIFLGIGTIGAMVGPIIAGYLAQFGVYKILLLWSCIITIFCAILLKKVPLKKNKFKHKFSVSDVNPFTQIFHFLRNKKLKGMALLGVLMNSKAQIYAIFFPIFVVQHIGLPVYYLGYLYAIPSFFHIFQAAFGKFFDKTSSEFGVLFGVFLSSVAIFMFPYVTSVYWLCLMLVFYGIGSAIWNVNAWAVMGNIAKKKEMEAEITGTYMSIAKLGVFITTLFSAMIVSKLGIAETMQWMAIVILIGVAICYFFFQPVFHPSGRMSSFDRFFKIKF